MKKTKTKNKGKNAIPDIEQAAVGGLDLRAFRVYPEACFKRFLLYERWLRWTITHDPKMLDEYDFYFELPFSEIVDELDEIAMNMKAQLEKSGWMDGMPPEKLQVRQK